MIRTGYIIGIILSVAAIITFYRYGDIIAQYRVVAVSRSPLVPQYAIDQVYRDQVIFFTRSVALISVIYFLYHICLYSYTVMKKIPGVKHGRPVLCIVVLLGMSVWDVMMFLSPTHISFDEVYFVWIAVALFICFTDFIAMTQIDKRLKHDDPDILDSGIGG